MNKSAVLFCALMFPAAVPSLGHAADVPKPNDLVGRWSGEPPMGGKIEITVTDVKDGKIKGNAEISNRGRGEHPMVSGEVKGKRVIIETRFEQGAAVTYRCEFTKTDEMPCIETGGKKTTFVRVKQ